MILANNSSRITNNKLVRVTNNRRAMINQTLSVYRITCMTISKMHRFYLVKVLLGTTDECAVVSFGKFP